MTDKIVSVLLSFTLAAIVIAWQSTMPEPSHERLARARSRAEVISRLGYFDVAAREMLELKNNGALAPSPLAVPSSQ